MIHTHKTNPTLLCRFAYGLFRRYGIVKATTKLVMILTKDESLTVLSRRRCVGISEVTTSTGLGHQYQELDKQMCFGSSQFCGAQPNAKENPNRTFIATTTVLRVLLTGSCTPIAPRTNKNVHWQAAPASLSVQSDQSAIANMYAAGWTYINFRLPTLSVKSIDKATATVLQRVETTCIVKGFTVPNDLIKIAP